MSSLFTFSLVTYLLGLQSLLSHGFPLTNSLDSLPERSLNGRQVVPDPIDALNTTFDSPALQKRAKIESTYDIPGVDACVKQVQAKGLVEKLPSVYYTGYPLQLTAAKQWASCHFQETESPEPQDYKFAAWRRIVDNKWAASVSFQIGEQMLETEPEFPDDLQKQFKDQFLKELSQAYAEESQGEVFLVVKDSVTSDDVSWDTTKAWGGEKDRLLCIDGC